MYLLCKQYVIGQVFEDRYVNFDDPDIPRLDLESKFDPFL